MQIEYEGKIYENINGRWYHNNMEVNSSLQNTLNSIYSKSIDIEKMTYNELLEYADGFKKTESYYIAIVYYEKALEKYDYLDNIRSILPRITSCFRLINKPEKAIEIYKKYYEEYSTSIDSDVLYTSLAAAYGDINDFDNAKRYADRAFAIAKSKGEKISEELLLVYERIKKYK